MKKGFCKRNIGREFFNGDGIFNSPGSVVKLFQTQQNKKNR